MTFAKPVVSNIQAKFKFPGLTKMISLQEINTLKLEVVRFYL